MATESQKLVLLEDISQIVVSSHDLQQTLDHITALLAERLDVEVCSIYLLEAGRLVLNSTKGLRPRAVGAVSMGLDEGLTGLAIETAQPVNVENAEEHPRYKFFPGIGEEAFTSFLAVPLIHRRRPIGALVVQTAEKRAFSQDTVRLLVTTASQLSTVIANARLLSTYSAPETAAQAEDPAAEVFLRGLGVSAGVGQGAVYPLAEEMGLETYPDQVVTTPEEELQHFETALLQSIQDVIRVRDQVTQSLSEEDGAIFHAHLMMLEDRGLQDKVRSKIREGHSAQRAVAKVARGYIETFMKLDDPYLRERAADVRDVAQRLLQHLREDTNGLEHTRFEEPTVVVADDLTPSRLVRLIQPELSGVVLARGGRNSHAAILCRSAGVPAVVGLESPLPHLESGQTAILDGSSGLVYFSPSEHVRQEYERLLQDSRRLNEELRSHVHEPAVTRDGEPVLLLGNAALLADVPEILAGGGEGVGLYRTEFPFLVRSSFPDEQAQLEIYRKIIEALDGRPATLRTLDIGGDKNLPYLPIPREDNPHLGWRSIRVSLELDEPFRIQLRALLRSALLGPIRIVFPMISTVGELRRARTILEEEKQLLRQTGLDVPDVPVGAMVEVPSAALALERLAPHADFFSIGTNDLVQYLLAVDRANRRVAHLYDPLHPTVLEVIGGVVETARKVERPLSVCGEMASRVLGAAALLAVGIRELSVSPGALPRIRRLVQTVELKRLRRLQRELRGAEDAAAVRDLLIAVLRQQGVPAPLWQGD